MRIPLHEGFPRCGGLRRSVGGQKRPLPVSWGQSRDVRQVVSEYDLAVPLMRAWVQGYRAGDAVYAVALGI